MKTRHFFTMVELLAVVALITLLAGIGFAGYSYAMNSAKRSATQSLIAQLGAALESFHTEMGFYPSSAAYGTITVHSGTNGLVDYVTFNTTKISETKQLKALLKVLDAEVLKKFATGTGGILQDSWGGNIYYRYPGAVKTTKFDIIAPGPDGKFGTTNWEGSDINTKLTGIGVFQTSDEWACDDIANFQK